MQIDIDKDDTFLSNYTIKKITIYNQKHKPLIINNMQNKFFTIENKQLVSDILLFELV